MANSQLLIGILLLGSLTWNLCAGLLPYLTEQDQESLKNVFAKSVESKADLSSVAYGIAGLKALGVPISNGPVSMKICVFSC